MIHYNDPERIGRGDIPIPVHCEAIAITAPGYDLPICIAVGLYDHMCGAGRVTKVIWAARSGKVSLMTASSHVAHAVPVLMVILTVRHQNLIQVTVSPRVHVRKPDPHQD